MEQIERSCYANVNVTCDMQTICEMTHAMRPKRKPRTKRSYRPASTSSGGFASADQTPRRSHSIQFTSISYIYSVSGNIANFEVTSSRVPNVPKWFKNKIMTSFPLDAPNLLPQLLTQTRLVRRCTASQSRERAKPPRFSQSSPHRSERIQFHSTGARGQNKNSRQATSTQRAVLSLRASAAHACGRRAGGGGPGGPRGPGGPGGADCVPARALAASSDAAGCRNHSDRVRMRARCRSCTYAPHHHVTSRDLVALTTRPRTPRFSLPLTHCATISSRQPERYFRTSAKSNVFRSPFVFNCFKSTC